MGTVTFTELTMHLAAHINAAYEDNEIFVAQRYGAPVAVLIGHDLWQAGQQRALEPASYEEHGSRWVPANLKRIREALDVGRHTVVTVDAVPKAVFTPYSWMRSHFEELGLPQTPQDPDCVMVVYRRPHTVAELEAQFADAADPDFEMDRRLSAGPARVPALRRERLRGVIYVHDGVVARIRSLGPVAQWEDLPGLHSLAPVSPALTHAEVDKLFPQLGIYPNDKREAHGKTWREYVDLDRRTDG